MQIWPAIDLRGGKCVRLEQGDYARETVFGDDPAAMARHWVEQGAKQLHLVDLDGAREGQPINLDSIEAVLSAVDVPCEVGGGIRDEAAVEQLLKLGVTRLVLGTRALTDQDWFRHLCRALPGRLCLGLDARNGMVATAGWLETSHVPAVDLAGHLADLPLAAIIYTDIAADGMLSGPNIPATAELTRAVSVPVIASGGVTTADDVRRLKAIGAAGCIIGRALYEGRIELREVQESD